MLRCPKCGKNNIKLTTRRGGAVHYKCLDCKWKFHVYRINRDWVPCDEFNKITTAQFRGTDIWIDKSLSDAEYRWTLKNELEKLYEASILTNYWEDHMWDKGLKKSKGKGLRIRIDPLDELFSRYIRLRDNYTCQRCGVKSKNVQCAHFHSRRKQQVRFDPDNACTLCMGDHLYLDSNPLEKVEFFQNRLGQVKFDLLNSRARITFPRPDKKMLTIYYQQQIKLLDARGNWK
jgi:predicted RNA-binding Zn-ribbon protein involved in translation (DUF1610 family)